MDPVYSSSTGFLNLLGSQCSQTLSLQSSDVPRFSEPCSESPTTKERKKWTTTDDEVLISGWLNTSKDPIIGNEQKGGTFWGRVAAYYNESANGSGSVPREWKQCKQRWARISDLVSKFVGCYEAASKEKSSGQNDDDVLKAAHEIFHNDQGTKFTLDHAWRVLKKEQKWCSLCLSKDSGKRKESSPCNGQEEVSECRPAGVKAAKAAKRKKTGKELEMEKMDQMLEKKEKISNKNLLNSLLLKSTPLSDLEEALKSQLLDAML